MTRRTDIEYKESKDKVVAYLTNKDSEIATKLVKKYQEYEELAEQAKLLSAEAREYSREAKETKDEYKIKLRETINNYFDTALDSTKTRIIQTQTFLLKLGKEETIARESKTIDYESAFNELIKIVDIPLNVLEEVLRKHTEIEMTIPEAKLYKPQKLIGLSESFKDIFTNIVSSLKNFYQNIINKFKDFDNKLESLEAKYL